jgi:hemerythrin-like domain-containing protein
MGNCHPTRALRDEHALILRVVDALERTLDHGREAAAARAAAGQFPTFFRLYTDALHHGKEEDLLFDAMAEEGFSKVDGPIAHMMEEHRLGRALVRQMADSADSLIDHPAAWRDFETAARDYVDLIRRHILKEDHGLFDTADSVLDGPACQRLCHAYEEVCARRFEGKTMQELEMLGEKLAGT